jgi:hypothetical protein
MKFDRAFFFLVVAECALVLLALINHGYTQEGLQAVVRYSGRLSLFIFSLIFLFHGKERSQLSSFLSTDYFLLFAVAHGIHLIELTSFVYFSNVKLIPIRVLGGFLAYAIIFLMPWFTSLQKSGKLKTSFYQRIELVYLFYVWLIFFLTYLPRVQGKLPQAGGTYAEHVALLGGVCVLLGIKIQQMILKKSISQNSKGL